MRTSQGYTSRALIVILAHLALHRHSTFSGNNVELRLRVHSGQPTLCDYTFQSDGPAHDSAQLATVPCAQCGDLFQGEILGGPFDGQLLEIRELRRSAKMSVQRCDLQIVEADSTGCHFDRGRQRRISYGNVLG